MRALAGLQGGDG
ncbi:hypothetical protein MKD33_07075, partial [Chromobacterium piscinae]